MFMRYLDVLSDWIARLSAWALFSIGLMLGYEVAARYFFNAPTIWAEELSRLLMIWAVFAGSSTLIAKNEHIRVSVLLNLFGARTRNVLDLISVLFIAVIAGIVAWYGTPIMMDSLERGRTTGSMLDIPSWWLQASVPVGFGLIFLQCIAKSVSLIIDIDRHRAATDTK